jgi:hypothetical protein
MKKLITLCLFSLALASCKKDEVVSSEVQVSTSLSGANEVPVVSSTASGSVAGTFNKTTKILTLTVNFTGLTPTAGHIHKGPVTGTGGVIIGFTAPFVSPYKFTSTALTTEQETDLLAGNYYVNFHTTTNPGGEIRGQLKIQ